MANFQNNALTDTGRSLLAHVGMGAVFTPTRVVLGSGYMPAGKTPRTMAAVANPVKSLPINRKKRTNDAKLIVGGVYSNQDITTEWKFRELALYAKAVYEDGTEVAECLYSYGNAGDSADTMPAYTSGQPVERQMDLVAYIGNDAKVDLTIASGVYLTREEAEELVETIFEYASKSFTGVISANWFGDAAPFTQTVTINGILPTMRQVHIKPVYSSDNEIRIKENNAWNMINDANVTAENSITFTCFKKKPDTAINISVEVTA